MSEINELRFHLIQDRATGALFQKPVGRLPRTTANANRFGEAPTVLAAD